MRGLSCAVLLLVGCYESRLVEPIVDPDPRCGDECGLPDVWGDCTAYGRSGGELGDACNPDTFEADCVVAIDECCGQRVRCTGEVVLVEETCGCDRPRFCEGYVPPPPGTRECVNHAQCGRFGPCLAPGRSLDCPPPTCVSDEECPDGSACVFVSAGPGCDPTTLCGPPCRAGGCPDDSTCWDGRCQPFFCDEGFPCPAGASCRPGADADVHGCQRQPCSVDFECPCGSCVNGRCVEGPGVCAF